MDAQAQRLSCRTSNSAWRRQAANLRQHAELTHLPAEARATLHREAEAADRLSIGTQKGPPIGVQKGPLCRC